MPNNQPKVMANGSGVGEINTTSSMLRASNTASRDTAANRAGAFMTVIVPDTARAERS